MKLAIDCRALRSTPAGIPNFLVAAINGIAQLHPAWKLYLLTNEKFNEELNKNLEIRENIEVLILPLKVLPNYAVVWYTFKVYSILEQLKPDLFWAPAFLLPPVLPAKVKTLVTISDMVFKEFKGTMSVTNRLIFELLHDQSLKKADMLWSISYATKKGIDKYFPVRKSRDVFVGFFINTQIFKRKQISSSEKENLSLRFNLHHKTLLFVGTLEPRKNLKYLLSLMPELAIQGYNLLVVGAKGWGNTDIKQIVDSPGYPRESVVFAGFLTSEELVSIYNLASVYVSTSHNEGFGMPQLEAMACGCPVVSPHNSAMIEVVEGAGETVKSWDAQDWINTINQVYTNREYYIQAGFQRVETYKVGHVIKNLTHYIEQHL